MVPFCVLLVAGVMLWHHDYQRRLNAAETVRREKLYRQSCLAAADTMTGHQFEEHYSSLLGLQGWRDMQVVGRKAGGDGGADILAADPDGCPVAIQCKAGRSRRESASKRCAS
jgi:HJR/Mrr/RecB family endonuclease